MFGLMLTIKRQYMETCVNYSLREDILYGHIVCDIAHILLSIFNVPVVKKLIESNNKLLTTEGDKKELERIVNWLDAALHITKLGLSGASIQTTGATA